MCCLARLHLISERDELMRTCIKLVIVLERKRPIGIIEKNQVWIESQKYLRLSLAAMT